MSSGALRTGSREPAVRAALREAAPIWGLLLVLSAGAWAYMVGQARDMGNGPGTMGMAFPFFVGMWALMMVAMMWPPLAPIALQETGAFERRARGATHLVGVGGFSAGFILPWALYGVVAFAAFAGTGRLVESSPGGAKWLGVGILAVAGIFQFTPTKRWALSHCRMSMSDHPDGRLGSSLASGVRDGAICVVCCWAFMAVFLAVGVMNVGVMVVLAVVIAAEKLLPGRFLGIFTRGIGVAFVVLAAVAIARPSMLPGLHAASMAGMHMMGG